MKKVMLILSVMLFLLTGCFPVISNNKSIKKESHSVSESEYRMGEPITTGDVELTVLAASIRTKLSDGSIFSYAPDEGNVFLVIDLKLKNIGNEPIRVDKSSFKLISGDMRFSRTSIFSSEALSYESLNPDSKTEKFIIFEISENIAENHDFQIIVEGDMFSDLGREKVIINLDSIKPVTDQHAVANDITTQPSGDTSQGTSGSTIPQTSGISQRIYKTGDIIVTKNIELTVLSSESYEEFRANNFFTYKPKAEGNVYLIINLAIKNIANEPIMLDNSSFSLTLGEKRFTSTTFFENDALSMDRLNPETLLEKYVAFNISQKIATDKDLRLVVEDTMFSEIGADNIIIELWK